ncbi:organic hydroperoxide resistance protein [Amycolatopsis taiwanensis]|uniref:Organic hydroperoxide resistance protein/OsmC-like protein n=1 Tax=Amycolatopsis taiwanensis TaxID=342230 RepID=A0A9W6VHA8_9PSEU|nr:organic hydroperoxide resistance protein [Amycolatopsis taiwanensis]GLY68555.1 putative organic hydroperoxide resistance protein/OsmC-like protein [Amycolatopsis taiwanensis]
MTDAKYTAEARVTGGRAHGRARTTDGEIDLALRLPKELGGAGGGANPEQLFAIGYAACFQTVLAGLAKREGLDAEDAVIDAKAMLIPIEGGRFKLGAELAVTLPSIQDASQAARLTHTAHQVCPYSNATRGNIDVAISVNGVPLTD